MVGTRSYRWRRSDENKALMHRFYEEWVHPGNVNVADEIIAPDCPLYLGGTLMGTGPEAFKHGRAMMYAGFLDLRWTIEEIISEGETVAERITGRGTHQGEFMGVPPTGTRVEITAVAMVHIRYGKIAEMRGAPDMLGLMQQNGAVPAPGESEEASPT
jgi:predicted ester cyclase